MSTNSNNAPLPPLDHAQRYDISTAIRYLRTSRKSIYQAITAGDLKTITVGTRRTKRGVVAGRRWVPGSEIARLSRVPAS
jgi:hypothetical protein